MKRAVITGLGIVSSIGNNQQEVLASLREGRSGITFSQELKDSGMRSHVWGNVKLDTTGLIDRKVVRFMSDASIYAFLSMEQAVADAGLAAEDYQNNPRVGLIAGSGGTLATFTSAGFVRRGLQEAGFTMQKCKGFGRKREMLCGVMDKKLALPSSAPWFARTGTDKREAAIIGGGIASALLSLALLRRGWQVTL